jgi:hypothetical protein
MVFPMGIPIHLPIQWVKLAKEKKKSLCNKNRIFLNFLWPKPKKKPDFP